MRCKRLLIRGVAAGALVLAVNGCAKDVTPKTAPRSQTTCPVMGGEIDRNLYVDHSGKRLYVCCAGCIAKIKEDPALYIERLESEGIALDRTPNQQ